MDKWRNCWLKWLRNFPKITELVSNGRIWRKTYSAVVEWEDLFYIWPHKIKLTTFFSWSLSDPLVPPDNARKKNEEKEFKEEPKCHLLLRASLECWGFGLCAVLLHSPFSLLPLWLDLAYVASFHSSVYVEISQLSCKTSIRC